MHQRDGDGGPQPLQTSACSKVLAPNLGAVSFGGRAAFAPDSSRGAKSHFFIVTRVSKNPLSPLDGNNWDRDVLELEKAKESIPTTAFSEKGYPCCEEAWKDSLKVIKPRCMPIQNEKPFLKIKMELIPINFWHPRALVCFFTARLPTQGPPGHCRPWTLEHLPTSLVHQPVPGLQLNQWKSIFKNALIRITSAFSSPSLLSHHPQGTPPKITPFSAGRVLGINKNGI